MGPVKIRDFYPVKDGEYSQEYKEKFQELYKNSPYIKLKEDNERKYGKYWKGKKF